MLRLKSWGFPHLLGVLTIRESYAIVGFSQLGVPYWGPYDKGILHYLGVYIGGGFLFS